MVTTTFEELTEQLERLSIQDKLRLIEHLTARLQRDLEVESFRRMPWADFVARTSGLLADDPIERPAQLLPEDRESLE
jgi:hypothetical protein